MDKAALRESVVNSLVLLEEELRSFVANANAGLWRKAVTNLYYAVFNAACAILRSKGVVVESHDAAQSLLSLHFVKAGVFARDTAKNFNTLMSLRHAADYKGEVLIEADEVSLQKRWALGFVGQCCGVLQALPAKMKVDTRPVQAALAAAKAVAIGPPERGGRARAG